MSINCAFMNARLVIVSKLAYRWCNASRAACKVLAAGLMIALALTEVAQAGDAGLGPPAAANVVDRFGVNLTTGYLMASGPSISIGVPGQGGLSYQSTWGGPMYTQNGWARTEGWESSVKHLSGGSTLGRMVTVMGQNEEFTAAGGGTWTATNGTGGTLIQSGSNYTYTDREGVVTEFSGVSLTPGPWVTVALASSITRPNGEVWTFNWRTISWMYVLQSITTNLGYQLKVNFNCGSSGSACYVEIDSIMLINNAVEYCSPTADSCSPSNSWPTLTFSGTNNTTVTDSLSHAWTLAGSVTLSGGYYHVTTTVTQPTGQSFSYLYDSDQFTGEWSNRRVTVGGDTWTYTITDNLDGTVTGSMYDPNGITRTVNTEMATGLPSGDAISGGSIAYGTGYAYYTGGLPWITSSSDGSSVVVSYDGNGNVTNRYTTGGTAPYDLAATYGITCNGSNYKNCNKPTITYDANGNDTLYTYSATHGGLEIEEGPAVNGGARPKTVYTYTASYAWYKNSGGSIVQAGVPVYLVTDVKTCTTANSCTNSSAERVTEFAYQSGSGSTASNLLQTQVVARAGDNSISSTTQASYDMYSNVDTTTAPNSAVTQYFYDADRRQVGIVQPDPDGGGGNPYPAIKITYDDSNRVLQTEQGTVPSQSRNDFDNNFTSLVQNASAYDSVTGAKIRDTASIGGTAQSVVQYGYDAGGRPTCTAKRQNASIFGSLPSDACTQSSAGSYGADQITQNHYDAGSRLEYVRTGVGTGLPIIEAKNGYNSTLPLMIEWVEDGKGNRSQYAYNGLNRLERIYFPDPSSINTYNPSDYEEYTYDDQGNMLTKRLRSGNTITLSYDELNRLELKDMPSGNDTYYTYNLVGNLLSARYQSTSGYGAIYTWDALGRKLTESSYTSGYTRAIASQYDSSGSRTRLTYPDSNYIEYTYDTLNRMYQVKENGSTVLATYSYDGPGRVNSITRSNSTTTSASYGGSSQSWSLTQDLASSGQDVTFSMDYSPAEQAVTRGISNSSYRYGVGSSSTTNYCANGLNQYVASTGGCSGGGGYSYDTNANVTSNVSHSLGYDLENKLTCVGGSCATMILSYDPVGRLLETNAPSTGTMHLAHRAQNID